MNPITIALNELFDQIPRRHSSENLVAINLIIAAYDELLISIEAINSYYEKNIPPFFDELEIVKATIKKSNDNKLSKKAKDFANFAKKCSCTFECANAISTVYDKKHWPSLL